MKTKYRFLFVLTLMFSLVTSAWAEKSWDSGNTKVTLSNDGIFTVAAVEGTDGKMADYLSAGQQPWANSSGSVRSVVVSDGVTGIGSYAFANFYGVKSVSIGNDVKSIGSYAFSSWWNNIHILTLPASVEFLANQALANNNIQQLYVKATTPPVLESLEAIRYFSIYVPEGSVVAYKTAEYWSNYASNIDIDFSDNFVPFAFDFSGYTTIGGTAWKGLEQQISVTPAEGLDIVSRTNMTENSFIPAQDATEFSFGVTYSSPDAANIAFEQQDITANLFFTPTELLDKFTISPSAPDENGKVADVKAGTEVKVAAKDGYKLRLTVSPILTGVTVYEKNDTITPADLKVGDIILGGVRVNDIAEKGILFVGNRYANNDGVRSGTMRPGGNDITFNADASLWGVYKPIDSEGNLGDAWRVERINEDNTDAFAYGVYLAGIKYNKDVTYSEDNTEATFPMPDEDVMVKCRLVRDLALCAEAGVMVNNVFADSIRLGTDNPEQGYYIFGGFRSAVVDKTDSLNPRMLTDDEVSYVLKMKQGDEYVDKPWQPGTWCLEATAKEGSDYIGTVYSKDFVMYEAYEIWFNNSNSKNLDVTVDGVTKSPVNYRFQYAAPEKKVEIKGKSGYLLSNVVVTNNANDTLEVEHNEMSDTYSFIMPRKDARFYYTMKRDIKIGVTAELASNRLRIEKTNEGYQLVNGNEALIPVVRDVIDTTRIVSMREGTHYTMTLEKQGNSVDEWITATDYNVGYYRLAITGMNNYVGTTYIYIELYHGYSVSILPGEYATFYSGSSVSLANNGSSAEMYYISAVSKSEVTLTKADPQAVPENTPIVLYNPADTATTALLIPDAEVMLADVSIADRDIICGTTEDRTFTADETAAADYYICNGKEFVKVRGAGTIPANRVYLKFMHAAAAAPRLVFGFGGTIPGTTGIGSVENGEQGNESWYDLNGRKLQGKPTQKGLYIKNGKKVVIK